MAERKSPAAKGKTSAEAGTKTAAEKTESRQIVADKKKEILEKPEKKVPGEVRRKQEVLEKPEKKVPGEVRRKQEVLEKPEKKVPGEVRRRQEVLEKPEKKVPAEVPQMPEKKAAAEKPEKKDAVEEPEKKAAAKEDEKPVKKAAAKTTKKKAPAKARARKTAAKKPPVKKAEEKAPAKQAEEKAAPKKAVKKASPEKAETKPSGMESSGKKAGNKETGTQKEGTGMAGQEEKKVKLLFVSPEVQPFAGTGGLGEVAGSLPVALAKDRKLDVRVILPYYRDIPREWKDQCTFLKWFYVKVAWRSQYCGLFELKKNDVTYYFVDNEYYFGREGLYGYYDDGERYAFFCKAVMDSIGQLDFYPDIVHANDWQTALVPIYNTVSYHYGFKSVFTIHNIAYQGQYDLAILGDVFDLPPEAGSYVEYHGCINLMKGAIETSNLVSTVSPTYAKELLDGQNAEGMEDIIRRNSFKLRGILNGIATGVYDPQTDPEIARNFSAEDLSGKAACKENLQELMNLPKEPDIPIIAIVSRLVGQKGIGLIRDIMEQLLQGRVQVVVLGTGEIAFEDYFRYLQGRYPDKIAVNIMFNQGLSHRIYAGSDIFLMPSISEPCGLAQMIACRYGTIPVVRETGGLSDSIKDCSLGEGNGFTFRDVDAFQLKDAVGRALALYQDKPDWTNLQKYAMGIDFSWKKSAAEYEGMYRELVSF